MTTRLFTRGASAYAANRRYACRTPSNTTDSPYKSACGAKMRSMVAVVETTSA
jgi:hypothetical protein